MKENRVTEATQFTYAAKVQHFYENAKVTANKLQENPLDDLRERLEGDAEEAAAAGLEAKKSWTKYIFDFSDKDVTQPDWLLNINGIDTFPRGSLNCITGKAGQGKTQWVYLLAATIARQAATLGIIPKRPATNLTADTEQEPWSLSDKGNRMLRLIGLPDFSPLPKGMTFLSLRQVESNKERLQITMDAIQELKPEVVFIDGITDMVEHLEDPDEAQQLVASLLKTIDEKGITLFVVIHQNEGTDSTKLRNFIGSELMRKSFTISEVTVDNGAFKVHQLKSRTILVPDYKFRIDANGNLTDNMITVTQTEEGHLWELMEKVIKQRKSTTFDSKKQIYLIIGSLKGCSEGQGKTFFDKAEALSIVSLVPNGHKYKMILCENPQQGETGNN